MASNRRLGTESSETRARLIEAAKQVLREEGWAALTARRVAEAVGLTRHTVHYYFGTMDDLLVAVMRGEGEKVREGLALAVQSANPLRVIWEMSGHATEFTYELLGQAMRRKSARAELVEHTKEFRRFLAEAVALELQARGLKPSVPPLAITLVMQSISQTVAVERELGNDLGHPETLALMENWFRSFAERGEWPAPPSSDVVDT